MFKFGYHRVKTKWNEEDIKLSNFLEQDISIKMDELISDVSKIAEITELTKNKWLNIHSHLIKWKDFKFFIKIILYLNLVNFNTVN